MYLSNIQQLPLQISLGIQGLLINLCACTRQVSRQILRMKEDAVPLWLSENIESGLPDVVLLYFEKIIPLLQLTTYIEELLAGYTIDSLEHMWGISWI